MKNKKLINTVLAVLAIAIAYIFNDQDGVGEAIVKALKQASQTEQQVPAEIGGHKDEAYKVKQAFDQQRSEVWVTIKGKVVKLLPDDNKGSRHQRFLITLNNAPRLLVAHNIDLAPRVPMNEGDSIWLRGRYEYNQKGGVLHWTHHDPKQPNVQAPREGWIEYAGKRYE